MLNISHDSVDVHLCGLCIYVLLCRHLLSAQLKVNMLQNIKLISQVLVHYVVEPLLNHLVNYEIHVKILSFLFSLHIYVILWGKEIRKLTGLLRRPSN